MFCSFHTRVDSFKFEVKKITSKETQLDIFILVALSQP